MKDFQTKDSKRLLEEARVDGQDIYVNMSAKNMIDASKLAQQMEENDPGICLELAEMLFTPESYKLVQYMRLEDLADLLDLVIKVLDEQENTLTERFKRPE